MANQKFVYLVLLTLLIPFSSISDSYGHGMGNEILPPVMLGSKMVALEITSDTWPDPYTKEISFVLFETDTGVTVKDVTSVSYTHLTLPTKG